MDQREIKKTQGVRKSKLRESQRSRAQSSEQVTREVAGRFLMHKGEVESFETRTPGRNARSDMGGHQEENNE